MGPTPTRRGFAGLWRWGLGALVLALAGVGAVLHQPVPTVLPSPRHDGLLALVEIPQAGPAWAMLGAAKSWGGRTAFRVDPLHPEIRIRQVDGEVGAAWTVRRTGDVSAELGVLRWDGRSLRFFPAEPTNEVLVLPLREVTALTFVEAKAGLRIFERGMSGQFSSLRPSWHAPGQLDRMLEKKSAERDTRAFGDFSELFSETAGDRPGWKVFADTSDHRTWWCESWQVVYHRSAGALSVLRCGYDDGGGAHGCYGSTGSNFIEGAEGIESLNFADLFWDPNGWQADVRRLLLEDLRRQGASWAQPEGPPPILGSMLALDAEELEGLDFTASADGVFVHFDPYEAGCYLEGWYIVALPWRALTPWVRADVVEAFTATPAIPGVPILPSPVRKDQVGAGGWGPHPTITVAAHRN